LKSDMVDSSRSAVGKHFHVFDGKSS